MYEKLNHTKKNTCNKMFGSCSCPYAKPLFYGYERKQENYIDDKRKML